MQNWNIMCENSGSSFGVNASCDGSDPVAVLMTAVLKIATATASKSICFFCGFFNVNVGSFSGHQEILLVESRTTCARYRVFRLKFLFRRRSQFRLPPRPRPPPHPFSQVQRKWSWSAEVEKSPVPTCRPWTVGAASGSRSPVPVAVSCLSARSTERTERSELVTDHWDRSEVKAKKKQQQKPSRFEVMAHFFQRQPNRIRSWVNAK